MKVQLQGIAYRNDPFYDRCGIRIPCDRAIVVEVGEETVAALRQDRWIRVTELAADTSVSGEQAMGLTGPLESLKFNELKAVAAGKGITVPVGMSRDALLEILKAQPELAADTGTGGAQ